MLKRRKLKKMIKCEFCHKEFQSTRRGKKQPRFCSRKCVSLWIRNSPEIIEKMRGPRKPLIQKICLYCKKEYQIPSLGKTSKKRMCCSRSCATKLKWTQPEFVKKIRTHPNNSPEHQSEMMERAHILNPNLAKESSIRMKLNNPMKSEETRKKVSEKLQGRTFLSRGGKGTGPTVPQLTLAKKLNVPLENLEYTITMTKKAKENFKSVPNFYQVDIAFPRKKIAIEVDGATHRTRKWKFLDKRKTEILNFLGWKILRFWNKEIMDDVDLVKKKIMSII